MVMYDIYNSATWEQFIDTRHKMHNKQPGIINYLPVNFISGITGIYPRMELATMPFILSCI